MCVVTKERKVVLKAQEAAEYLRISLFTLNKIERQGLLRPFRTPGGHRRYTLEMLNQYLEENRFSTTNPAIAQEGS
jgi:excisionase family DNA binding protein